MTAHLSAVDFGPVSLSDVRLLLLQARQSRAIARGFADQGQMTAARQFDDAAAGSVDLAGRLVDQLLLNERAAESAIRLGAVKDAVAEPAGDAALTRILALPHVRQAWERAQRMAALDGVELPVVLDASSAVEALCYLKAGLGDVIADALSRGDISLAMAEALRRRQLHLLELLNIACAPPLAIDGEAPAAAPASPRPAEDIVVRFVDGPLADASLVADPAVCRLYIGSRPVAEAARDACIPLALDGCQLDGYYAQGADPTVFVWQPVPPPAPATSHAAH